MFDLKVTLDDREPFTVKADGRDIRAWESEHQESWFEKESASFTDITWLAYSASRRAGVFSGTWEEFDALCGMVKDTSDPTETSDTPREATDE